MIKHPFRPNKAPVARAIDKAARRREFNETKLTVFRDAYFDAWSYQTRASNYYMSPAQYKKSCIDNGISPESFVIFGEAA